MRRNWLLAFGVASLLGAGGYIARDMITRTARSGVDYLCAQPRKVALAEDALREALDFKRPELFVYARIRLEDASAGCLNIIGMNATAKALLGAMRCQGYAFKRDRELGLKAIREAHALDPRVSPQYFDVCKIV